jgi:hypothetical protein
MAPPVYGTMTDANPRREADGPASDTSFGPTLGALRELLVAAPPEEEEKTPGPAVNECGHTFFRESRPPE